MINAGRSGYLCSWKAVVGNHHRERETCKTTLVVENCAFIEKNLKLKCFRKFFPQIAACFFQKALTPKTSVNVLSQGPSTCSPGLSLNQHWDQEN